MSDTHTHPKTDELFVYWVPADTDIPMEMKAVANDWRALAQLVGGYFEVVRGRYMPELPCGCMMAMGVNETGLLRRLPANPRVDVFYPFPPGICGDVFLVGEGLVKTQDGDDVDFLSLPEAMKVWEGPGSPIPQERLGHW